DCRPNAGTSTQSTLTGRGSLTPPPQARIPATWFTATISQRCLQDRNLVSPMTTGKTFVQFAFTSEMLQTVPPCNPTAELPGSLNSARSSAKSPHLDSAFPYDVLATTGPIEEFYGTSG